MLPAKVGHSMGARCRAICWILLACWPATLALAGSADTIRFPGGVTPAVLSEIDEPANASAVAFSPDGRLAAVAWPSESGKPETRIRLYRAGAGRTDEIAAPGVIRALLYAPDRDGFFGLLRRPGRRQPGETLLVGIEGGRTKPRRLRPVVSDAVALAHWTAGGSLLILSGDEIRSVLLDGLRSGPLFRLPGENLSIVSLAGSDIVVVGQTDRLLLLRLDDPPGEEQMPIRESVAVPSPVRGLAASPDGTSVLARLEDRRVLEVRFGPLGFTERGRAAFVAGLDHGSVREPIRLAPRIEAELPVATVVSAPPGPEPPREAVAVPRAPTPREAKPAPAERVPDEGAAPPIAEPPAPPVPPARQGAEEPGRKDAPQLSGRLVGPAASDVREIVLLGPSNLLREAVRIRPDADGGWQVDDLRPGRYRVQLDGGGDRVLVSEPGFLVLEIAPRGSTRAPDFRVLRSYRP